MKILLNEKLSNHTTIHVGGNVNAIYFPENTEDLVEIVKSKSKKDIIILGNGSNIVFHDNKVNSIPICMKKYNTKKIYIHNDYNYLKSATKIPEIKVSAGISCARLAKFAHKHKIPNFEFLHGIPGTIGGALRMNAGAFKQEIWNIVNTFTIMDIRGNISTFHRKEMQTSYRNINLNKNKFFIEATFKIHSSGPRFFNKKLLVDYSLVRKKSQPINQWSSGCIFKNPDTNNSASYLIESAGLKTKRIGGFYVSKKHSNYFINDGTGTYNDLIQLIDYVKKTIRLKYNIKLKEEIQIYKI